MASRSTFSSPSCSTSRPECSAAVAPLAPRHTPAKSVDSVVLISEETRAILRRKTGKEYLTSADLPACVELTCCEDLVDVSAFGAVEELYLGGCTAVTDVSALGAVKKLVLFRTGVVDVSALGGVVTLNLAECTALTDVSALGGVQHLNLYGCTGLTDVSALGGVKELDLRECTGITDYSAVPRAMRNSS